MARTETGTFPARIERIVKAFFPSAKAGLSRHSPGDNSRRWQIEVLDAKTGQLVRTLPNLGHLKSADFDMYLRGMEDIIFYSMHIRKTISPPWTTA